MKRWSIVLMLLGCGQSIPETHSYRLELPATPVDDRIVAPCDAAPASLLVDDLEVDAAYDQLEIIYRESPYRLDRYHYHQWSAPPGQLVGDALREGLSSTELFAGVGRAWDGNADAVVRGRLEAIEEIDRSPTRWVGRVALELELVDARSERRLWSRRFDVQRPLHARNPDGLAAAVSTMLAEIVRASAPAMATALAKSACAAVHDVDARDGSPAE